MSEYQSALQSLRERYPEKFIDEVRIFGNIRGGDRIFIGTGCGEPAHLVQALVDYVHANPTAFFDTEVLQVWSLGVAPYTDEKFKSNFRQNSFFISNVNREAINRGIADYTPIFLFSVPGLFRRRLVPVDVALIQTSMPDDHGYVSLGISVDIVKAATEAADLVIAQINPHMPRVHGDSFIHVRDIDYIVHYEEPLLEYETNVSDETVERIGAYVSRIIQDGDTIQVGYGSMPNSILMHLKDKKHLGVHTELLSDGIAELMRMGVIDNTKKEIDRGKTVASFCMGKRSTYEFVRDNPGVEFRPVSYTNDPMVIARHQNMVAINSALKIDLTGQATAESLGSMFYSGIGGQADFMRGAILSRGGKTILAMESTAEKGSISRIVPSLIEGEAVSLIRGDIHYVVTEYGIAYLHGKNIRERAMALIAIAHPKFRHELVGEAKKRGLVYQDQAYIPGEKGEYPDYLETYRTTKTGLKMLLRPVRISDEPLLKDFFYSLSSDFMYRRFMSARRDMPHERLQKFVVIDYTREMTILAVVQEEEKDIIVGMGQYYIEEHSHSAEVAFVVRDDYKGRGIALELLSHMIHLARKSGLIYLTAEVLKDNEPMLNLFRKMFPALERRIGDEVYLLKMTL
ncbi:MAG TPA: GNAT family N-acetyltransferase [Dissulfurispiraceae bacterium]|nr:GNAT family N-acetyltransferase [Dissulfurispiraceae bacterium]